MTGKVKQALKLDRMAVRRAVSERFDISVVGQKYYELYQSMLAF